MAPTIKGRIVEWNSAKSYGFAETGRMRVFLHTRDFAEKRKSPEVGDRVRFVLGTDAKGRPCATKAVHLGNGGAITLTQIFVFAALVALPFLALGEAVARVSVPAWLLRIYLVGISFVTFVAYAWDKHRARNQGWRVAENSLHLLELLGGWPGAFLAQRWYRHKVSKRGFQVVFWLIVAIYQFVALDFLMDWRISGGVWREVLARFQFSP